MVTVFAYDCGAHSARPKTSANTKTKTKTQAASQSQSQTQHQRRCSRLRPRRRQHRPDRSRPRRPTQSSPVDVAATSTGARVSGEERRQRPNETVATTMPNPSPNESEAARRQKPSQVSVASVASLAAQTLLRTNERLTLSETVSPEVACPRRRGDGSLGSQIRANVSALPMGPLWRVACSGLFNPTKSARDNPHRSRASGAQTRKDPFRRRSSAMGALGTC